MAMRLPTASLSNNAVVPFPFGTRLTMNSQMPSPGRLDMEYARAPDTPGNDNSAYCPGRKPT